MPSPATPAVAAARVTAPESTASFASNATHWAAVVWLMLAANVTTEQWGQ